MEIELLQFAAKKIYLTEVEIELFPICSKKKKNKQKNEFTTYNCNKTVSFLYKRRVWAINLDHNMKKTMKQSNKLTIQIPFYKFKEYSRNLGIFYYIQGLFQCT